ncbi:MAG: Arc family DNA-binding protein [Calditrichaeota bacterium]|nr:MAG: Arc family DNA-binding protein [Calditrichota bacterium]
MVTLTVKNIPDSLYEKLKEAAQRNNNSLNDEIIKRLECALNQNTSDSEDFLQKVRELRASIHAPLLTDEILRAIRTDKRM